ncbi:bro-h [Leucania separata nucleopolyhedrovirus]|uniref:Bro-h n=1 Tax=Leucania separata nucleopolyhedrovirus TaxID=1307956 RepID=Q0IKX6_NPVLS|nr:bro-h [Leucania separata nucleopolyhedrovirus]AAR28907.1 bro-h [Leucania separata nucleopolyhedrovirus]
MSIRLDCLLRQTASDMETRSGRMTCHDRNKYKRILIHRFIDEQVGGGPNKGDDDTTATTDAKKSIDRQQQQHKLLQVPLIRDVYKNMCYLRERNIQQHRTINMLKLALVNERKKYQTLLSEEGRRKITTCDQCNRAPRSSTESLVSSSSSSSSSSSPPPVMMEFVKLAVFRNDRTFYVVTGQHAYVKAKSKQFSCGTRRVIDTLTVSPKLDCQSILREAKKSYGALVEISKRRLYFKYERNADEFQTKLKYMYDVCKKSCTGVVVV